MRPSYHKLSGVVNDHYSEETILQCIDSGIDVFGSTVKTVIYWRFSTLHNLERKDILNKPQAFTECLRNFFGERAFNVEQAIVGAILGKFHLNDVTLSDSATRAIIEARKKVRSL
ncbi:MAG: hypothetical protein M1587_00240 [Thaumarchaeota archaeon]|nr:hypothetical protein [Nitrososphaerota archaeon]